MAYASGKVCVQFNKHVEQSAKEEFLKQHGFDPALVGNNRRRVILSVPKGQENDWICKLATVDLVQFAELLGIYKTPESMMIGRKGT